MLVLDESLKKTRSGSIYMTTVVDLVPSYEAVDIMIDTLGFGLDSDGKSYFVSCVFWEDTK